MKNLLRFVALACWMLSSVSVARAADPVTMQVEAPLAHTVKPLSVQVKFGRWFPIAVTLTNTGDAVNGRLTLRLTALSDNDSNARTLVTYTDVDLPTNARKRIWLYGRADGDNWDGATVAFAARGRKTLEAPFALEQAEPGERVVLTISDAGETLKYLSGFKGQRFGIASEIHQVYNVSPVAGQSFLHPVQATHELVPDRWFGLETADVVVLHDFVHSALSPEQIAALRGYVAGGGALVVPGGQNWQRLAQSPLADLWPIQPTASGAATAGETSELVQRYLGARNLSGADRLGGAPAMIARGALRADARRIAGRGGTPLVAVRNWGDGQVIWTAFDPTKPPFIGWRGQPNLWLELLNLTSRPHRLESVDPQQRLGAPNPNGYYGGYRGGAGGGYYNGYYGDGQPPLDATGGLLQVIKKLPQLQMPPTSVIAWFLALYVFILVPVNYFILRLIDKRELAWVTVPAIAVAFSFASYAAARSIKGTDLLARHINIVQGSSGNLARADAMLWLRSPRKGYYNISSPQTQTALTDYYDYSHNGAAHGGETTLRQSDASHSFRVEDYPVAMWEEAQFVGQSVLEVGQGIKVTRNSGVLSVQNATPFDLRGAVVFSGGRIFRCGKDGELKAGTSANATLVTDLGEIGPQMLGPIETASGVNKLFPPPVGAPKSDTTLSTLANTALSTALGSDFGKTDVGTLFIGWSDQPVAPLQMEKENARAQNVSLFVWRLPSLAASPMGKTRLSANVRSTSSESLSSEPGSSAGRISEYEAAFAGGMVPQSVEIVASGWMVYNNADAYNRHKKVALSKVPDVQLQTWNFASGAWQNLTALSRSSKAGGAWELKKTVAGVELKNALRRPDNVLRVRLQTTPATLAKGDIRVRGTT